MNIAPNPPQGCTGLYPYRRIMLHAHSLLRPHQAGRHRSIVPPNAHVPPGHRFAMGSAVYSLRLSLEQPFCPLKRRKRQEHVRRTVLSRSHRQSLHMPKPLKGRQRRSFRSDAHKYQGLSSTFHAVHRVGLLCPFDHVIWFHCLLKHTNIG